MLKKDYQVKINFNRIPIIIIFQNRQYRHKNVTKISPDKTLISFLTIKTFTFDQKASAPLTENDNLIILNTHLNVR